VVLRDGAWVLIQRDEEPPQPTRSTRRRTRSDDPPGTILRSEPIDGTPSGATAARAVRIDGPERDSDRGFGCRVRADRCRTRRWPAGRGLGPRHERRRISVRTVARVPAAARQIPELAEFLDTGAVVVFTDYPGLGTPDRIRISSARAKGERCSTASVRRTSSEAASDKAAIFGHSQGGHSSLFATELAPTYAPELDVVGVAAMAPRPISRS
jgi:hypothetical protein